MLIQSALPISSGNASSQNSTTSFTFFRLTSILDYVVYDVWLFVELIVVYFLFVETRGASLEETAAILDGTEIQERFVEGVARATEKDGKSQVVLEVKSAETDGKTGRHITQ